MPRCDSLEAFCHSSVPSSCKQPCSSIFARVGEGQKARNATTVEMIAARVLPGIAWYIAARMRAKVVRASPRRSIGVANAQPPFSPPCQ